MINAMALTPVTLLMLSLNNQGLAQTYPMMKTDYKAYYK
ncbi:hypothetical protein SVI_3586 [Shewanella violacea DSS12]|uniref:Uncharacterized protein n=1 Tax=Shewanella violacea (strain JCM 10179 / CIP 106290 / LMG 19151 / DSS12) TaxID=637905 RepID=D4ZC12_SHEVD|nr:hypothetical protein SVI_3586 [Shewanella violacea DSS12]